MATLTAETVREILREHILSNYLFSEDPSALDDNESFQDTRLIDSMGMMQLIQFVETEFHFSIAEADLVPEKLDSVNRLVQLVVERTAPVRPVPAPSLIHLLAAATAIQPDRTALAMRDERMSYAQLWEQVGRVARGLAGLGVAPGDRVALLTQQTPGTVASYYGILAAGAVVVPLDAKSTPRELAARLGHSGATVMVTDMRHQAQAAAIADGPQALTVVTLQHLVAATTPGPFTGDVPRSTEDVAALVYTSGTTDEPKGVMLSHANLVANTLAIIEYLRLGPQDIVLSPLPICYVYGASVVHTHLGVGATVVLSDMVYPQRTVDQMAEERVTGFAGVAWMYAALLSRTTFGSGAALPHLRYLTHAGSHMPAQDISRITTALPHADLFVMYGQTEATARITYLPPADITTHLGSVGRPVRDVQVEVRRPDGSLADPHESGDVYVSGPNVMMGYWQAPDATRAVLSEDDRGRWLRTGDIGRLDEDGYLYLEGRSSEMVKVWGHRVSLNEIEEVARLLPGVAEAAAVGVPHTLCGQAVHLVIVREPGSTLTSEQVLAHCRGQLSSFKMPQQVLFTDTLPHTYTGKLQRRHLVGLARVAS